MMKYVSIALGSASLVSLAVVALWGFTDPVVARGAFWFILASSISLALITVFVTTISYAADDTPPTAGMFAVTVFAAVAILAIARQTEPGFWDENATVPAPADNTPVSAPVDPDHYDKPEDFKGE